MTELNDTRRLKAAGFTAVILVASSVFGEYIREYIAEIISGPGVWIPLAYVVQIGLMASILVIPILAVMHILDI